MAEPAPGELPEGLREAFEHLGSLRFDQFMELALYAPATGFFAAHGGAGRREGDFVTSPEVGPTFGAVLARHLDGLWEHLGRPDPFTVVEAGAGRAALAISVRAAAPRCAPSLQWVLVERSAALRALHGEHLPLSGDPFDTPAGPLAGSGPRFSSRESMPDASDAHPVDSVVANELLDNIPTRLLERRGGTWREVLVTVAADGLLGWELADAPPLVVEAFDEVVPGAGEGSRVPWQPGAGAWVTRALELLDRGELLVFDYGDSTGSMAGRPQQEWLRTYRSHGRGSSPLTDVGRQDITVDVALDQLPPPDELVTQAEWLRANGIEELVADAQRRWQERAGVGDLAAVRARSVPLEAEALVDPDGLGRFRVLTWNQPD